MERARLRRDQDDLVIITGYPGAGKSTLAYQIARKVDPEFTHTRMVTSSADLVEAAKKAPRYAAIVLDEPVEGAMAADHATELNKRLIKFLQVCRARNQIFIILIPSIYDLARGIRERRARWWFYVPARGNALLHEAVRSPYSDETWWQPRLDFDFPPATSSDWQTYYRLKKDYVDGYDGRRRKVKEDPIELEAERILELPGFRQLAASAAAWLPQKKNRYTSAEWEAYGPLLGV